MEDQTERALPAVIEAQVLDIAPVISVEEFERRLEAMRDFTKRNLHEGIDYGVIPGTDKPTLLKPGAEKLLRWYGLAVDIQILPTSRLDLRGDILDIELEGTVRSPGRGIVLGQVHANANSEERRYKDARRQTWDCRAWLGEGEERKRCGWSGTTEPAGLICPECGGERLRRPQTLGDQKNTLLKMADKRLVVGAAHLYTGASEAYTQDLEDSDIPGAAPEPSLGACPIHKKAFREGKYGWYCPTKLADGTWCKEKPKKAPQAPQPATPGQPSGGEPAGAPAPTTEATAPTGPASATGAELLKAKQRVAGIFGGQQLRTSVQKGMFADYAKAVGMERAPASLADPMWTVEMLDDFLAFLTSGRAGTAEADDIPDEQ